MAFVRGEADTFIRSYINGAIRVSLAGVGRWDGADELGRVNVPGLRSAGCGCSVLNGWLESARGDAPNESIVQTVTINRAAFTVRHFGGKRVGWMCR